MKGILNNNYDFVFKDIAQAMLLEAYAADLPYIKKQIKTTYILRCEKFTF